MHGLAERLPLGIASGSRGREIERVLHRHGLRGSFQSLVSADEVPRSKPAPDLYLAAWRQLSARAGGGGPLAAADCLAIEDSLHGIEAALAAGMRCLAVAHSYPAALLGRAGRVLERIDELTPQDVLGGRVF